MLLVYLNPFMPNMKGGFNQPEKYVSFGKLVIIPGES